MQYLLTPVAETGDRFGDFSPYVPAINDRGTVAFYAALKGGGAGIFNSTGEGITTAADTISCPIIDICSHPDINRHGAITFYAILEYGGGVILIDDGQLIPLAETGSRFEHIGPLGPTMNDQGIIAFRAGIKSDHSGIYTASKGSNNTIVETGDLFNGFQGLPVINNHGTVAFRADLKDGGQGIYSRKGGTIETIADTSSIYRDLGLFPMTNDRGIVAFNATLKSGIAGIFSVSDGRRTNVVDTNGPFEGFRGVLINNADWIIFYATPRDGTLGIYCGPDIISDKILSVGQPLLDSTVTEFALNPVSINNVGQIAIRVKLADNKQVIIRADPMS